MNAEGIYVDRKYMVVLPKQEYLFLVNTVNVYIAEQMRRKHFKKIIDCDLYGRVKQYQTKKTEEKMR